jgi:hypothetical protein
MKRSGSLIVLDAPSKRVDGGAAADEVEGEKVSPEPERDFRDFVECMKLATASYDDLLKSSYMAIAMLLKFIVGAKLNGCNLLQGEVRTTVAAVRAGGPGSHVVAV